MDGYGGYILSIDEPRRVNVVEEHLQRDGWFSDAISAADWRLRENEIVLLSYNGDEIAYAALARRGQRVVTGKYRVTFSNVVPFDPSVSLAEVQPKIPNRLQASFTRASSGVAQRFTSAVWRALMDALKEARPETADRLAGLQRLREIGPGGFSDPGFATVAEEKDATNLALRISGFSPQAITSWLPARDGPAPFLKALTVARLEEDRIIAHDAQVFGDWQSFKRDQVGAVEFRRPGERLFVLTAKATSTSATLPAISLPSH